MITSLKAVADLERMGDLALHIAKVARMRYPASAVPDDVRGTIREMGEVALSIVEKTRQVLEGQDISLAEQLEREDDAMDALHRGCSRTCCPASGRTAWSRPSTSR